MFDIWQLLRPVTKIFYLGEVRNAEGTLIGRDKVCSVSI